MARPWETDEVVGADAPPPIDPNMTLREAAAPAPRPRPWDTDQVVGQASAPVPGQELLQDPSQYLSVGDIFKGSMFSDPSQEMQFYAEQAGVPISDITMQGGEVARRGPEGELYQLRPPGLLSGAARFGGDALAAGGATAGALLPRLNPIVGGALGTAAGDTARQYLGAFEGEDLGWDERGMLALKEQLINAAGEGAGRLFTKTTGLGKQYNLGRTIEDDTIAQGIQLLEKARRFGIEQLTPGEQTNLMSLRILERVLQRRGGGPDEIIEKFLNIRNPQIEGAIERVFGDIGLDVGLEGAGQLAREQSQQAINAALKQAQDAARPFYHQALNMGAEPDLGPVMNSIRHRKFREAEGTATRKALDSVENMLTQEGGKPITAINRMHTAVVHIGEEILQNPNVSRSTKRQLKAVRDRLIGSINKATRTDEFPRGVYGHAMRIYAEGMPGMTALENNIIGQLAGRQDTTLHQAANSILGPASSPERVKDARAVIEAQNPEAWGAIVRAHLQDVFNKVNDVGVSEQNVGKVFQRVSAGNKRKRMMLKEALTEEQFEVYSDLMEVLEATGRSFTSGESITAFALDVEKRLMAETGGARMLAQLFSPQEIGTQVREYFANVQTGAYAKHLAEIITSPDGLEAVSRWQIGDPSSRRAAVELARHLLQYGDLELSEEDTMRAFRKQQAEKNLRTKEALGGYR